jgi:hypothetical protein
MKYLIKKLIRAILISLTIGSIATVGFSVNVLSAAENQKSMVICCKNNHNYPIKLTIFYYDIVGKGQLKGGFLLLPNEEKDLVANKKNLISKRKHFRYFAERVEPTGLNRPKGFSIRDKEFREVAHKLKEAQFNIKHDNGEDKLYFEIN